MCEFTDKKYIKKATDYFTGKNINDIRHPLLMRRFPHAFEPAHCPVCGTYLSLHERRPFGRATRSMCAECYEILVTDGTSYSCFLCGRTLPEYKIRVQRHNIREIREHIHDEACLEYWTVIHNIAVNEPDATPDIKLIPEHTQSGIPFEDFINQRQIGDRIIDADHVKIPRRNALQVPLTNSYKGKPVKFLD